MPPAPATGWSSWAPRWPPLAAGQSYPPLGYSDTGAPMFTYEDRERALAGPQLVTAAPPEPPAPVVAPPPPENRRNLAIGLAAVVVLVIYWVSLQIGRSVRGLEDDAQLLGAGKPVRPGDYPISEIATVSEALADASRQRRMAETEVRLLMRELAHRSKNQLTVIAAMAKQSARSADTVADFVGGFERRIHGLARSTDLLLAHGIAGVELRDIIASQVDPLCPLDSGRVTLEGPSLKLNTQAAQILGMAAHELATNAVKYGAFSGEAGRIAVSWGISGDRLALCWRESMTPLAEPASRRGFGTTVLENMVGRSLGAAVTRTLNPDGIEWRFDIPLVGLDVDREPEDAAGGAGTPGDGQPPVASTGAEN